MKKFILFVFVLCVNIANAQSDSINLEFKDLNLVYSCNAFKNQPNWKVSHGSPSYNNPYVYFVSDNTGSDGLFKKFVFRCGFNYELEFEVHKPNYWGDAVLNIYAANELTEHIETTCITNHYLNLNEDKIEKIAVLDDRNEYYHVKIENWTPTSYYSYIWLTSSCCTSSDSIGISKIIVRTKEQFDTIPPTAPTNLKLVRIENNYPNYNQKALITWDKSTDNLCDISYYLTLIKNDSYHNFSTTNNFYLFNNIPANCKPLKLYIIAKDYSGNLSERSKNLIFYPKPYMKSIEVVDRDYTNQNKVVKEATDKVVFQPGFKFTANQDNEFFIGRIVTCNNAKNENNEEFQIDTLKQTECINSIVSTPKITITPLKKTNISTNFSTTQINIYPNPTNDIFTISMSDNESYDIEIYNTSGQLILSKNKISNSAQIDLSAHTQGIYIIKLKTENNTYFEKIIKN